MSEVTTHPEFTYGVSTDSGQTVISGKNGGNIRGKGGKWVEWNAAGGLTFTITVTELLENDDSSTPQAIPITEAFESPPASVDVPSFKAKLNKLTRGEPLRVLKYTIKATNATAADPLIIVDR
jgi:hypothetical protein